MYSTINAENHNQMMDGIYLTRYDANKDKQGDEVVVKVCAGVDKSGRIRDGYKLMKIVDYQVWRNQR